ncbi:hypothetical protein FGB62_395g00 [Gracilaria domingensis]|nr:hypothetical protein FGB62_395g00 [Gracilaria domingensis]
MVRRTRNMPAQYLHVGARGVGFLVSAVLENPISAQHGPLCQSSGRALGQMGWTADEADVLIRRWVLLLRFRTPGMHRGRSQAVADVPVLAQNIADARSPFYLQSSGVRFSAEHKLRPAGPVGSEADAGSRDEPSIHIVCGSSSPASS